MLQGKLNIAFVALTVALGGFLLGFDATVISGVVPFIKEYFSLDGTSGDLKLGFAVSSLGWGAMAGNAIAGPLSDRFGRRRVLLGTALLFVMSSLLAASATSFPSFVAARIVGGLAVGGAILIAPVYIAEIAPAEKRGSLVSLNQLMIVIGISASFFSNYFLLNLGEHNWRYMLGVQMVPALLYFTLLWFVPESPRWLLLKGKDEAALLVLRRVAGERQAQENLQQIQRSLTTKAVSRGFRGLFDSRVRPIMIIALGLAFFQQITGINAIFYYLPTIFAQAGGGVNDAFRQAVMVGVVNVLMTFVAIWLIDKLGRKPLLIMGIAGMALSLFAISWAFSQESYNARLVLIAIIGFVASFAISLGPVMWVLLSEIFPNEQRAAAISVAGFWNALTSATVTMIFPWALATLSSGGTFLAFGLFATAALLFVVLLVPETKGRTLEQLENDLMTAKA
ncbi:sugar porter family MFS transporter [Peristeroidobacter soli]|jgi:sugar porter (SP) family MFS transporter|uniref:sugar porter family MFS transporter n=1 Tax=Peristeroidobacter soli TaxID=2497877 RepID=UPI00101DD0F9|nr:sugar porter family MFS transporter [Peristeroidobacter soli]